jgi:uncharacterized protein (DUF433 family)
VYRTSHPFAIKRFHTDGKRIFAEAGHALAGTPLPRPTYKELSRYERALETVATPFFRKFDYEHEEVRRYWPLGKEKSVVLDPARSFGEPIDTASGVPTAVLYQLYTAGESISRIAQWYQVGAEAVGAAIEYEQSLAA